MAEARNGAGAGRRVAKGALVAGGPGRGRLAAVGSVQDVLALMHSEGLEETIVFAEQASVTNLAPVMARVAGIVSTTGGPTSHLAIVARGFETTCVLSTEFEVPVEELGGRVVEIREDGSIVAVDG